MLKQISIIVATSMICGCSAFKMWYGSDKPMMSYVIVDDDGGVHAKAIEDKASAGKRGYVITWSPEYNGAFVNRTGKGCIQPAIYATTASGQASIPTEIFTKGASSGSLEGKYSEALEKLITVTDQSTFLSIGMYGICQLSISDGLNQQQAAELVKLLFEKASKASTKPDSQTNVSGGTVNRPLGGS